MLSPWAALATAACLLAAEPAVAPSEPQLALLKTFREEFLLLTPGEGKYPKKFDLGSSRPGDQATPVHQVTFAYNFAIAKYEVPQDLWEAVMGGNPSRWKGKRNSVELLSLADARAFCTKATQLLSAAKLIEPTQVVRLPSEAEWEYAARAETTTRFSFGDDPKTLGDFGWFTGNAAGNDPPVGAKKPNPWGLYDMHGYLWEWCEDAWHEDYTGAPTDGSAWTKGGDLKQGVARSGSWKDGPDKLSSAYRQAFAIDAKDDALGLRCVLATAPPPQVSAPQKPTPFQPTVQADFVPADSKLELLWAEGEFTEGPAAAPDGSIFFSDIGNTIYRFDPSTKQTKPFRHPSGRANGLMFSSTGILYACEGANTGGQRRISQTTGIVGEKDGTVTTIADRFAGKKFNSPNDLVLDSKGRIYFSDPRYVGDDPRELDYEAVFVISADGKAVSVATRDVQRPNGLIISPDGKRAYVADNHPQGNKHLLSFEIAADGSLTNKQILFDFAAGRAIDGMTIDTEGNIYATAGTGDRSGIYIFSPHGKALALIPVPGDPTNCTFGRGKEANTLYITAAIGPAVADKGPKYGLFRVELKKAGFHP